MHKLAISLAVLGTAFLIMLAATSAEAQNSRSWVSGTGSNANPCSRSQPCSSFVGALAKTNAGGEINCLDRANFADGNSPTLLITKSITIDCVGTQGRIEANQGDLTAILINTPSDTEVVVLRGLDIYGSSVSGHGIEVNAVAALHVDKCMIHDFASNQSGWGIEFSHPGSSDSELYVSDTVVMNNGSASSGGGILMRPFNAANSVTRVMLNRVEARNNFFGIKADGTSSFISGGVINMTVRDSVSSGNRSNGIVGTSSSSGPAIVMTIDHSTSSHNAIAGFGVIADGPRTFMGLTSTTISGNLNGVGTSNGGLLFSYGNNSIAGNSTDGNTSSVIGLK